MRIVIDWVATSGSWTFDHVVIFALTLVCLLDAYVCCRTDDDIGVWFPRLPTLNCTE